MARPALHERGQDLVQLPAHVQEMVRDVLVAARAPWGWSQWDSTDPDGRDLRTATVGPLTVVYWVNTAAERLHVIEIVWLG